MSEGLYEDVGEYEIHIAGTIYEYMPYRFFTEIDYNGAVAWVEDNEQQHVNPRLVDVRSIIENDVAQIIQQILLFKTKKDVSVNNPQSKIGGISVYAPKLLSVL